MPELLAACPGAVERLKEYFDNLPKEISQDAQDECFPF